ncbi:uncharacterized protein KY384_002057 [Bacidia gigantensis]|uniref:uncharacterized protein n=1 Tax=Bacidia gigantensis TaxID=2732470 RepID=UPI001D0549D8|nr:uncharacterized protein KY384_002057 [Bacidia gigantensis]KAG8533274.1 hypothetical protein KY384_002057 [Bacidia gigantensis]
MPLTPPELPPKDKPPTLKHRLKPVGQPELPRPGDNNHYDGRTWNQRFLDYFESHEAHGVNSETTERNLGGMQCDSYTSAETNPELAVALDHYKDRGLQVVTISVTEDRLKAFFVRRSIDWQKKQTPKEDWPRSFMIRRGITDYTRADIGMSNPKVGHVFLVDWQCKIRWTGCGDASDEEKESLVSCVKRLMERPGSKTIEKGKSRTSSVQRLKQPMS